MTDTSHRSKVDPDGVPLSGWHTRRPPTNHLPTSIDDGLARAQQRITQEADALDAVAARHGVVLKPLKSFATRAADSKGSGFGRGLVAPSRAARGLPESPAGDAGTGFRGSEG